MLAVLETHPVQYRAPVYRMLQARFGIPVTAIYGSDFSVAGYRDREFGATLAWDTDLLGGYRPLFLSRAAAGGPQRVSTRGMRRALAAARPAAVLLTGSSPRFHRVAFYHAWRAGVPILFRGEATDHARPRGPAKTWARDHALRWLYRRCARLLYVGRRAYQHFRRLGCPDEALVFSPYCVDASTFQCDEAARTRLRSAERQRLGAGDGDVILLFSGKLIPKKGPQLLVGSLEHLPAPVRGRAVVVFLGEGPLRESLDAPARGQASGRVRFLGFHNQTDLSRYYHAADVLALPSVHSETWGLVVNEALHHGVPCVVSDAVGCAPDLVEPGTTGELCETASASSLAAALLRALKLVDRPDVREACRRRVAGYTVERAAAGLAEAYEAAVGRAARADCLA